ncbi:uncharacterized protein JCM6883_005233 [Sporobolomyces salmoneus]|uniref:uncharacterized protein n=1 Tax=Sporobolomyces salmoneus TaxID=183962 RepID=UPI003174CD6C
MGLFDKKKKEKIPDIGGYDQGPPPPQSSGGRPGYAASTNSYASSQYGGGGGPPSYRSTGPGYVPPSQGGNGYGQTSQYARNQIPPQQQGPPYGNGYPQQQQQQFEQPPPVKEKSGKWGFGGKNKAAEQEARNELFQGAPPPGQYSFTQGRGDPYAQQGPSSGGGAYGGGQQEQQEQKFETEEDEEVEGIKQQMRFTKQESLASTRNAVRIAREAEETARATLDKLGDQSDRIANTERHLDLAKAHNDRAVDETKELEALNRSIFRPNISWNKAAKRDREERRLLDRHNAEKAEREQVRREQFESRQRIDQTYHKMDREAENAAGARSRAKARGAERGRYQFEATASDDEVEDEIDTNLEELGGLAGRLKMLAMTAGQEVDSQNAKLGKITGKVDVLDNNVVKSTQRLARVK